MENFRKIVTYKFHNELAKNDISYIQMELVKIDGITSFEVLPESVTVDYVTLKLAEKSVKEIFREMGYPVETERKKRPRIVKKFIENLAKSNKELYGKKRLDCCNLK